MKRRGWTSMSFKKIAENVNPKLTEMYLMEIVEEFPEKINRCKLHEGVFGVKLLVFE
jgi:broad-specificity NMP kinase